MIYGDGDQTRDFTFVANAVRANMLACIAPAKGCCGEVFNVGCGTRISVNELWLRVAALCECSAAPNYVPARSGDVRDSLASLERSQSALGYSPVASIEEGLRQTVEWYTLRKALSEASSQTVAIRPAEARIEELAPNDYQAVV